MRSPLGVPEPLDGDPSSRFLESGIDCSGDGVESEGDLIGSMSGKVLGQGPGVEVTSRGLEVPGKLLSPFKDGVRQ